MSEGLRRWAVRLGLIACAGLSSSVARAANDVVIFADRDLGPAAGAAIAPMASTIRTVETDVRAGDAACTTLPGNRVRFALLPRNPSQVEIDVCAGGAGADVIAVPVGFQAMALATPAKGVVFSITSGDLFRALGANAAGARPSAWDQLGTGYPAAPVAVMPALSGSVAQQIFEARMEAVCVGASPSASMPFDRAGRLAFCGALRKDAAVQPRPAGADAVAVWAKTAGAGAVAVVSVSELAALDGVVVPLLIDNVTPSAVNIAAGRYAAARPVTLMIVLPRDADPIRRDVARRAAFDLMSEAMIGPSGALAASGVVALQAADRLEARTKAVAFIE
jgi:ABC-type phosphate transport system substrate-binding protein